MMLQSAFILDIFDLAFDGYEHGHLLRKQVPFLTETGREHTGIGVFIDFRADQGIEPYKTPTGHVRNFDNEGVPFEMLNGVVIKNEQLNILADAIIYITNGVIDCVEIWNMIGEDYPANDPENYELAQSWLPPAEARTIKR